MTKRIAIVGECMIELNGKPFGEMQQTYGGDTLNTAVYLARIANDIVQVSYISVLGEDRLSIEMRRRWQAEGVNTDWVLSDSQHQPGLYLIQLDEHGERTFLYWRNDSAARYLVQHPSFEQVKATLTQFDAIYLSGISLAILPSDDREILINALIESKVPLIFDGNYRPKLWDSREQTQQCYQQLLSNTQLALMTFDDEQALWDDVSPEITIARLQSAGVKEIVLKLGAEGARYVGNGQDVLVPTQKIDNIVDTTAAGDSFNAGFLQAYLQGEPPKTCCMVGNYLAGIVIQHRGAIIDAQYLEERIKL